MQPFIWKLTAGEDIIALDALKNRGLQIESDIHTGRPGSWFQVRRNHAVQCIVLKVADTDFENGSLWATYGISWPWRWQAEARLFHEICKTFDECCERWI